MKKLTLLLVASAVLLYAGERFAKIDSNGVAIVDKSTAYFQYWSIVEDRKNNVSWEMKTADNLNSKYNWEEAIDYCEGLQLGGYNDWRLPNQYEIKSLVDYTQSNPVVNAIYFPSTMTPSIIWSSTSENDANAWYLTLSSGEVFYNKKTSTYGVMCVRSDL